MIAIVLAILIGLPRVLGVKTALYQAVAHLYVGGMIGAYAVARKQRLPYLIAAVGLTVLETVCFLISRR